MFASGTARMKGKFMRTMISILAWETAFAVFVQRLLKVFGVTVCVAVLTLSACASNAPTNEDRAARFQLDVLNALTPIEQPVEDWLPLTIAAIKTGSDEPQIWAAGRSKVPAKIDIKAMRIASISKLAVAYGAMALVERGVLELDEDVSTYLGWSLRHPEFPNTPITVRLLLSHRSSLVDGAPYQAVLPITMQEMMEDERFYMLGKAPGEYFAYANIGYGVLATVMEAAAQERFDILMENLVFGPAGLDIGYNWHGVSLSRQAQALPIGRIGVPDEPSDTKAVITIETLEEFEEGADTTSKPVQDTQENTATAVRTESQSNGDDDVINVAIDQDPIGPSPTRTALKGYKPGINAAVFSPQGGLRASIRDVVKLGELLQTQGKINSVRILKAQTVRQMMQPQWTLNNAATNGDPYGGLMTSYGLGVHIFEPNQACFETKEKRYFGHFGEAYGLLGGVLVDAKSSKVFAYLLPYTPRALSETLSDCSGLYGWEEQFLATALAPDDD